ncbi:unnamed protein product [Brassica oleracea var. botrytis]
MKGANTDAYLWESFEYPTDSWLPNMLVGTNPEIILVHTSTLNVLMWALILGYMGFLYV